MEIKQIITHNDHYKIIADQTEFVFPKNKTSSEIIDLIKPSFEKTIVVQDYIASQLLYQLHNIAQLNKWYKEKPENLLDTEMMFRFDEAYHFLYDLTKYFKIEIPSNFFVQKDFDNMVQ